jgi:hypothetical protein
MRMYMNTAMKSLQRALHIFMHTDHGSTVGYETRYRVTITTTTRGEGAIMLITLRFNTGKLQ